MVHSERAQQLCALPHDLAYASLPLRLGDVLCNKPVNFKKPEPSSKRESWGTLSGLSKLQSYNGTDSRIDFIRLCPERENTQRAGVK